MSEKNVIYIYPHYFTKLEYVDITAEDERFKNTIFLITRNSIRHEDMNTDVIRKEFERVIKMYGGDDVEFRVVLMGYSPFVALVYAVAKEFKLKCVYFTHEKGKLVEREVR